MRPSLALAAEALLAALVIALTPGCAEESPGSAEVADPVDARSGDAGPDVHPAWSLVAFAPDGAPLAGARYAAWVGDSLLTWGELDAAGAWTSDEYREHDAICVGVYATSLPPRLIELACGAPGRLEHPSAASVSGRVIHGGLPAAGRELELWCDSQLVPFDLVPEVARGVLQLDRNSHRRLLATTDAHGDFRFEGLPPGWTGRVEVVPELTEVREHGQSRARRDLAAPETDLVIELPIRVRLVGRILTAEGEPPPPPRRRQPSDVFEVEGGVELRLHSADNHANKRGSRWTGASRLAVREDGSFELSVRPELGYSRLEVRARWSWDYASLHVALPDLAHAAAEVDLGELRLVPWREEVEVALVDDGGAPISTGRLTPLVRGPGPADEWTQVGWESRSDRHGRYWVRAGVTADVLRVDSPGYRTAWFDLPDADVELALQPLAEARLRLPDAFELAPSDAEGTLRALPTRLYGAEYEHDRSLTVAPGMKEVFVVADRLGRPARSVTVPALARGELRALGWVEVPTATASVRVEDGGGAPLANLAVLGGRSPDDVRFLGHTDVDGALAANELAPGRLFLFARHQGRALTADVELIEATESRVVLWPSD